MALTKKTARISLRSLKNSSNEIQEQEENKNPIGILLSKKRKVLTLRKSTALNNEKISLLNFKKSTLFYDEVEEKDFLDILNAGNLSQEEKEEQKVIFYTQKITLEKIERLENKTQKESQSIKKEANELKKVFQGTAVRTLERIEKIERETKKEGKAIARRAFEEKKKLIAEVFNVTGLQEEISYTNEHGEKIEGKNFFLSTTKEVGRVFAEVSNGEDAETLRSACCALRIKSEPSEEEKKEAYALETFIIKNSRGAKRMLKQREYLNNKAKKKHA